jgi:hypothetical protein
MTKDEALRLALEALEGVLDDSPKVLDASISGGLYEVVQCRDAITAIKAALEAKNEPFMASYEHKQYGYYKDESGSLKLGDIPQRTWVGLTDDEIEQGCKESWVTEQAFQSAAWWAEAKLKEKNT